MTDLRAAAQQALEQSEQQAALSPSLLMGAKASYELGRLDGADEENRACERIVLEALPTGRRQDTAAAIRARRRYS